MELFSLLVTSLKYQSVNAEIIIIVIIITTIVKVIVIMVTMLGIIRDPSGESYHRTCANPTGINA